MLTRFAIWGLIFFHFLIEVRFEEFTPQMRAAFNCSFYLFAALVMLDYGNGKNLKDIILYWSWAIVWFAAFIMEILAVFVDIPDFGFRFFFLTPLVFSAIIEIKKWK